MLESCAIYGYGSREYNKVMSMKRRERERKRWRAIKFSSFLVTTTTLPCHRTDSLFIVLSTFLVRRWFRADGGKEVRISQSKF